MTRRQRQDLFRILISLGALIGLAFVEPAPWVLGLYGVAYGIIGYDVLLKALKNLKHNQWLDEHFLMSVATLGAFAIGEYPEALAVMVFYQVGELFQSVAVRQSRQSIAALMDLRPDRAKVYRDGQWIDVDPEDVAVDELIRVIPGERIPLDGVVTEGHSVVDTSA